MKKTLLLFSALVLTMSMWATTYTPQPGTNTIKAVYDGGLQDGDVIELANGSYTEWSTLTFTTKVTIKAAENAKVSLGVYDLKIQNDFEINGIDVKNISGDNYLFHVNAAVAGTIAFKNCTMKVKDGEITTPTPYIFVETTGQGTMIIDNCVFSSNTKSQGSVVYAGSKTITNFTMKNSTVYGCATQCVYCEGITNASVDRCTFYNTAAQILYIKGALTTCTVQNCIFTASTVLTDNCIKTYGGTVSNCIYYNLDAPRGGSGSGYATVTDCTKADPLFKDAASADFTLKGGSPALTAGEGGTAAGDPRWVPTTRDPKIEVEPGTSKLSAALASAQAGDTLILKTGTYTENSAVTVDKQITILAAEGAEPKMYIAKILTNAAFEVNGVDISLNGDDYLFRTTVGGDFSVIFRNCVLHDCKSIFYYLSSDQTINSLIIDNCIFKNNTVRAENGVINGQGTITNFEMRNSTVMNCTGSFPVRVYSASNIVVDHCTFYRVGKQALRLAESSKTNTTISVSNCVVASDSATTDYAYYVYNGSLSNSVYYNSPDPGYRSGLTVSNVINADPQFIDAANGDFNFPITSPLFLAATDGKHIGDPRWTVTSMGEGIDLPAVLNKANVSATHKDMTYYGESQDYFDFGPDGSKDYSARWAGWIVNIEKGKYKVTAEAVVPSGGYQLQVEIINPTTGEVACTKVAPYGKDSIGELDLNSLAVGQYFVRFKNITTWSQVKARNLTFTQIGGVPVDMPDTLVGDEHVMLSQYAVIKNDSILFADDDHSWLVDQGWAKWNIKVSEKAKYSFTANARVPEGIAGNGWKYKVSIIDGTDTIYSKSKYGESNVDETVDLGSCVLEPGTYTLMMQNIQNFSKGRLLSVEVEKEYLALDIKETAENNSALAEAVGNTYKVTLTRAAMPNTMYSTICLPFALSSEEIAASAMASDSIMTLSKTKVEGDEVILYFTLVTSIEAGVPYIIKPTNEAADLSFDAVEIETATASSTEADDATFYGTFVKTHLDKQTQYYLGANNLLYTPMSGDTESIKGLRGYFEIEQEQGAPIRRASIRMGTDVVTTLDLVDGKAMPNNKFMLNGQIVIRVNGVDYLLNGMNK